MADRTKVFIAYCFPEKRWLDRVQAELDPVLGNGRCVIWDERKLASGVMWKTELPDVLASTKVAMMIVSDLFLESDFVTRARLPALLEMERKNGLEICWVLASHCLFELAGLKEADAGPPDNFPVHAQTLRDELKLVANNLHNKFPNLRICYVSSRIYGSGSI